MGGIDIINYFLVHRGKIVKKLCYNLSISNRIELFVYYKGKSKTSHYLPGGNTYKLFRGNDLFLLKKYGINEDERYISILDNLRE